MTLELADKGPSSKSLYYIENDTSKPVAIEITVKSRKMEKSGKEVNSDIDNEVLIFPNQLIVKPNEKRSIRIQYRGKAVSAEKSYRVIFNQLPIEMKEDKNKGTQIKLNLKYVTSLYIGKEDFKENLVLGRATIKNGKLNVPVINKGNKHKILNDAQLKLDTGSKKILTLKGKSVLKGLEGENILANTTRVFQIPLPSKLKNVNRPIVGKIIVP